MFLYIVIINTTKDRYAVQHVNGRLLIIDASADHILGLGIQVARNKS